MASCHTHATIVTSIGGYGILPYPRCHRHIHRRVWHPAIPTLPSSHIHAPIISTYSISGVRGYGKMPYPPKNTTAIISKMPYPPKNV